ncbi:MAG: CopG family transcriptional regulator [Clostridia bacterium]|nr:CopG family transcriptional regulator [Clostridia bacterium]
MSDQFVVMPKEPTRRKKDDTAIIMSLRLDKKIQERFDELAFKSGHSRNALMVMALRYALDHLEFAEDK